MLGFPLGLWPNPPSSVACQEFFQCIWLMVPRGAKTVLPKQRDMEQVDAECEERVSRVEIQVCRPFTIRWLEYGKPFYQIRSASPTLFVAVCLLPFWHSWTSRLLKYISYSQLSPASSALVQMDVM